MYKNYYKVTRTHLSLNKDAPSPRAIQATGHIVGLPILGGLITNIADTMTRVGTKPKYPRHQDYVIS